MGIIGIVVVGNDKSNMDIIKKVKAIANLRIFKKFIRKTIIYL